MPVPLEDAVRRILAEGRDLTLATLRADGWPQCNTVSYAADGLAVYFGCDPGSAKARNLAHDARVSASVDLPYSHLNEIRGLSLAGRASPVTDPAEMAAVGALFAAKFKGEIEQYVMPGSGQIALFRIDPAVASVLDYRQGFGHTDLVTLAA